MRNEGSPDPLRVVVLRELRRLFYEAAVTRSPQPVDFDELAHREKVTVLEVQGVVAELIALECVKAIDEAEHRAVTEGRCAITKRGIEYLISWEASMEVPVVQSRWRAAGFDLTAAPAAADVETRFLA